jgi:hypothetical protein
MPITARPVAQIQADGQASVLLLSVRCIVVAVRFFIAGLLYLLRFRARR